MAVIIDMTDAAVKREYEEFIRLLNSSVHCVQRCRPELYPYMMAVLEIVRTDDRLEQGLFVLMRAFKEAVEVNMTTIQQLKNK